MVPTKTGGLCDSARGLRRLAPGCPAWPSWPAWSRPSRAVVPNRLGTRDLVLFFSFLRSVFWKTVFPWSRGRRGLLWWFRYFIYLLCTLFLYDISSTSDHQAVIRPRRLEPPLRRDDCALHGFMVPCAVFSLQPSGHASIQCTPLLSSTESSIFYSLPVKSNSWFLSKAILFKITKCKF